MADLFSDIFPEVHIEAGASARDEELKVISLPPNRSLHRRTNELVSLLELQYWETPSAFPLRVDHFPADLARAVFSSDNITAYASAFFISFHPHTPFIHRSSFDLSTAPLHLLLALSLSGSIFAAPTDEALSARCFFSLGEEHIFGLLRKIISMRDVCSDNHVAIVQAAVLMHALQVDSNHEGVRHRIRVHRFPEVVAAVRALGLFDMTRSSTWDTSSWEDYVHDEVRIRYLTRS